MKVCYVGKKDVGKISFAFIIIVLLITVICVIFSKKDVKETLLSNNEPQIKTSSDVITFLKGYGYDCSEPVYSKDEVLIPKEFNEIYIKYGKFQKNQGYNIEKFKGKTVIRYTYRISSDKNELIYANVLVYKNKVISGEIVNPDIQNGYMHTFDKKVYYSEVK